MNNIGRNYNAEIWAQPNFFKPERFLNLDEAHEGLLIPFGAGRRYEVTLGIDTTYSFLRNCIGQQYAMLEVRIVLAALIRNFDFELCPLSCVETIQKFTFRPKDGLGVLFYSREK